MAAGRRDTAKFWEKLHVTLIAVARLYGACRRFALDPEDLAQGALEQTIRFLDAETEVDCRSVILSLEMKKRAVGYAKACIHNAILTEGRRAGARRKGMATHWDRVHEEGFVEVSRRRIATPYETAIAREFIRHARKLMSAGRAGRVCAALEAMLEDGGDFSDPRDLARYLTRMAGISPNDLSYERRKLRRLLGRLGYSRQELNDDA